MNLAAVAAVFPVIFLGELPDKTMFASLVMATRARPLAVWLGATAAFAVHVVIATTVGALLLDILPHRAAELAVALTFFAGTGSMLDDLRPATTGFVNVSVARIITAMVVLGGYAGWAALA